MSNGIVIFVLVIYACTSCVSQKNKHLQEHIISLKNSYCKAPFKYNFNQQLPSYNSDSILSVNKMLRNDFTDQSILILNALGMIDEVNEMFKIKENKDLESRLKNVRVKADNQS